MVGRGLVHHRTDFHTACRHGHARVVGLTLGLDIPLLIEPAEELGCCRLPTDLPAHRRFLPFASVLHDGPALTFSGPENQWPSRN